MTNHYYHITIFPIFQQNTGVSANIDSEHGSTHTRSYPSFHRDSIFHVAKKRLGHEALVFLKRC